MSRPPKKRAIVCDFDGTVTTHDQGGGLARHFSAPADRIIQKQFARGEITLYELQNQIWPRLKITQKEIEEFMDNHAVIRDGLHELLKYCADSGVDFYIVSGGFDFYIPYLLSKYQLNLPDPTKLFTNRGTPSANGFRVSFPYRNPNCDYCSNCKGQFIRELRRQHKDLFIIGVGDGESDFCMAKETDQLFACSNLLRHCEKEGINHIPFNTFLDILNFIK